MGVRGTTGESATMLLLFLLLCCICSAFIGSNSNANHGRTYGRPSPSSTVPRCETPSVPTGAARQASSSSSDVSTEQSSCLDKNALYIEGLLENLQGLLDKYICNGSPLVREQSLNVLDQISMHAKDDGTFLRRSVRMVKRAGVPVEPSYWDRYQPAASTEKSLGRTDSAQRREQAAARKRWEQQQRRDSSSSSDSTRSVGSNVAGGVNPKGRSALSRRTNGEQKDPFFSSVMNGDTDIQSPAAATRTPDDLARMANDKHHLQRRMDATSSHDETTTNGASLDRSTETVAANKVSGIVARLGGGSTFTGESLGIGGLDDVLAKIKRRIWIPLAAPPQLLQELGIHPVRGLLLYGKPGCGKTLLARSLGKILSPLRPVTVVSGPEIMDKFVGSSEKNLREIFDNPPDIYDSFRRGEKDGGDAVARAALHVIVMDEFDAICRTRGGTNGSQGDAGVARDSVVNQMLAKMDGVHPLPVPTLVIGLTNKRSLIDPALLRPGRFEVQLEVPPPSTDEQRISILKVHTKAMHQTGRVFVRDAPTGAAAKLVQNALSSSQKEYNVIPSYDELLQLLASSCDGFSGASLAGVARAAASHALERSVLSLSDDESTSADNVMLDCVVTEADFLAAIEDVKSSMSNSDSASSSAGDTESAANDQISTENSEASTS